MSGDDGPEPAGVGVLVLLVKIPVGLFDDGVETLELVLAADWIPADKERELLGDPTLRVVTANGRLAAMLDHYKMRRVSITNYSA
jgi:hypothetical protein